MVPCAPITSYAHPQCASIATHNSHHSTAVPRQVATPLTVVIASPAKPLARRDRKSTRLNSSHQIISYAVFCLKKKKIEKISYSTLFFLFFFFNDTATTEIYTLSLHDALPI